jgi:hypothetical protein
MSDLVKRTHASLRETRKPFELLSGDTKCREFPGSASMLHLRIQLPICLTIAPNCGTQGRCGRARSRPGSTSADGRSHTIVFTAGHKSVRKVTLKFVSHFVSPDKAPYQVKCQHEMQDAEQVFDSEKAGVSAFHVARQCRAGAGRAVRADPCPARQHSVRQRRNQQGRWRPGPRLITATVSA